MTPSPRHPASVAHSVTTPSATAVRRRAREAPARRRITFSQVLVPVTPLVPPPDGRGAGCPSRPSSLLPPTGAPGTRNSVPAGPVPVRSPALPPVGAEVPVTVRVMATTSEAEAKTRHRRIPGWLELILLLVTALALSLLIKTFFVQMFFVPSESMEPLLVKDDRILVQKMSYWKGEVHRGDVIVF